MIHNIFVTLKALHVRGIAPWKMFGLISIKRRRSSFTPTPDEPEEQEQDKVFLYPDPWYSEIKLHTSPDCTDIKPKFYFCTYEGNDAMRVLWVALVPDHLLIRVIWEAAAAAGTADVGGRLSCALGTTPTQTDAAPEPRWWLKTKVFRG